jgi:hypothetical protein
MSAAVVLAMALLLAGCRSPEVGRYTTIDASRVAVTQALGAWSDYCRQVEGTPARVPLSTHLKVKAAYDAYRQAAVAAVDAELAWAAGTGPEPDGTQVNRISALAAEVIAAMQAAKEGK